jgi:Zn-dependent M16 (insulinase) family peptidase
MAFKLNEFFNLIKKEKIKESNTIVYFFEHKKTKASVIYFQNDNENATFGTFFKTLPENSKGTTHILEHSVFEGSKKYNQENSLDYIINNSLASNFNAMTFPDKTMYFFCSSFQKDYLNLLDIYLDFVYFPNLEEKTLRKEGHFYKKTTAGYEFNGIVFNEMKNSLLGFYSKLYDSMSHFFNEGTYSYISGGDPIEVVDLTIDEMRNYHKNTYHPSNSHTILFGKINKNKVFEKLNEIYSQFEYEAKNFEIIATPIAENKKMTIEYQDMDGGENNFVKYYLLKGLNTEEDFLGIDLVRNYLMSYDFSVLRKVIEESGLCTSVEEVYISDVKIPVFGILCRGVNHENIEKLEELIDRNIFKLSKNISVEIKNLLYRRYEFKLKEIEFYTNQGLDVLYSCSRYLNYNQDPLIGLRNYKSLKIIAKLLKGKNFEKFLKEKFLPSQTLSIKFTPSKDLLNEYNQKIEQKLKTKLELEDLKILDRQIEEHEKFLNLEKIEPNYKNLKKIKIQDLDLKVKKFNTGVKDNSFYSLLNSSDLVRLGLNFDLSDFNFSKLEYLGIYLYQVNQISTKNFDFQNFSMLKKNYFSEFQLKPSYIYNSKLDKKILFINLFMKYLNSDEDKVFEILKEFILNLDFENKARIKFILSEQYQLIKESLAENPLEHAIYKSLSFVSEIDYLNYDIYSIPMLNKLKFILENFDNEFESLSRELKLIHNFIFTQNCIVNFGLSESLISKIPDIAQRLQDDLNVIPADLSKINNLKIPGYKTLEENKNFYLPTNSDTNFNVMSVKYNKLNKSDKNVIKILEPYFHQYLWNNIRVKNGAYGAHFQIDKNSEYSLFFSYSDPRINSTFETYSNTRKNFDLSKFKKYSFEKMKLKFLSKYKEINTNAEIFNKSFYNYVRDESDQDRQNQLDQKISLNYLSFKDLFKNLKDIKFVVKVIASTDKRIKEFKEKYEKFS